MLVIIFSNAAKRSLYGKDGDPSQMLAMQSREESINKLYTSESGERRMHNWGSNSLEVQLKVVFS